MHAGVTKTPVRKARRLEGEMKELGRSGTGSMCLMRVAKRHMFALSVIFVCL